MSQQKKIRMIKKYQDNLYLIDKNILRQFMKENTEVTTHMNNVILTKRPDNQKP